jgi:hypothetical protein
MNIGRYGINLNEMQSMRHFRRGKDRVQTTRVSKEGNEPTQGAATNNSDDSDQISDQHYKGLIKPRMSLIEHFTG